MTARGCFGKLGYPTRAEAATVCTKVRRRRKDKEAAALSVYHCRHCSKFHIGRDIRKGCKSEPGDRRRPDEILAKLRRYLELTGAAR